MLHQSILRKWIKHSHYCDLNGYCRDPGEKHGYYVPFFTTIIFGHSVLSLFITEFSLSISATPGLCNCIIPNIHSWIGYCYPLCGYYVPWKTTNQRNYAATATGAFENAMLMIFAPLFWRANLELSFRFWYHCKDTRFCLWIHLLHLCQHHFSPVLLFCPLDGRTFIFDNIVNEYYSAYEFTPTKCQTHKNHGKRNCYYS